MSATLPLSAQIRAVQTARGALQRGDKLRPAERELMDERLRAVERTLAWLKRNEDAVRGYVESRKGDAA